MWFSFTQVLPNESDFPNISQSWQGITAALAIASSPITSVYLFLWGLSASKNTLESPRSYLGSKGGHPLSLPDEGWGLLKS